MNQWEGVDIEGEGIYDTGEDVLELYSFDVVNRFNVTVKSSSFK